MGHLPKRQATLKDVFGCHSSCVHGLLHVIWITMRGDSSEVGFKYVKLEQQINVWFLNSGDW